MVASPTDMEFWPPRAHDRDFDWSLPTSVAYKDEDTDIYTPIFRESRSKLDYSYHENPILERQQYQDLVLSRVLDIVNGNGETAGDVETVSTATSSENTSQRPFLVYTAGPMGVGKSFVLSQLHQRGQIFPLETFVKIDPDMLKSELPEISGYLQHDSDTAATKLHKESTQMSDVLFEYSLAANRNILVTTEV